MEMITLLHPLPHSVTRSIFSLRAIHAGQEFYTLSRMG
jgi:hypothetical protein